jgi:UDPglucose 6-dehydrogenase
MANFKELVDIEMAETAMSVIKDADCIILMTEWKEYTELNYGNIKEEMKGNVVIDGRRGFDQNKMEEAGFDYKAIGLG